MDLISRQAAIDVLAEHEKSRGHNYTLFVDIVSECAEIIRNLPPAQPEAKTNANNDWVILNKDKILKAGMEGREIEFRIGGRLFAIMEKAQ